MSASYDVVVVGSGPGGAVTAERCARRGLRVLVLEEGERHEPGAVPAYSLEQMRRMYRDHGLTVALGRPSIAYTEARCVGGGSEVNAGLYHRPDSAVLAEWTDRNGVEALSAAELAPWHELVETRLQVQHRPLPLPAASDVLRRGAEHLGWAGLDVPRWAGPDADGRTTVNTMQRTYLDDAARAGCELRPRTRVTRLEISGGAVRRVVCGSGGSVRAEHVVVSAGAIQTPALLQRSGLGGPIGRGLSVHPTVKVVARFADAVTDPAEVPSFQVREFAPDLTLGGSASRPALLALALGDTWSRDRGLLAEPQRNAVYYASIRSSGTGLVRAVRGFDAPFVTYRLTRDDLDLLRSGLARLLHLLLAAGAELVVPCYPGAPVVRTGADVAPAAAGLGRDAALMTVHLTGTAPMGERADRCPVDSFGRVRGVGNLTVNDGSLLPSAPGVNPQGAIMAVAHRNMARMLGVEVDPLLPSADVTVLTGGAGWFGRAFLAALAAPTRDHGPVARDGEVRVLAARPREVPDILEVFPRAVVHVGDVADPAVLTALFDGAAGASVVHAAGVIHPDRMSEFERVNHGGTVAVLEAAARAGVRRVVHLSSNSPFGANPRPGDAFRQQEPYRPYLGYGTSKMRAEVAVLAAHRRGDVPTVVVRPPWFYGPWQPERQTRFFSMVAAGRFPVPGDGTQQRSMTYVDNLVQGVALAERHPAAPGQAFWVADRHAYPLREVVATVRRALDEEGYRTRGGAVGLPRAAAAAAQAADRVLQSRGRYSAQLHVLGELAESIRCDVSQTEEVLGYDPQVSLLEGMRRSVRWCAGRGIDLGPRVDRKATA